MVGKFALGKLVLGEILFTPQFQKNILTSYSKRGIDKLLELILKMERVSRSI